MSNADWDIAWCETCRETHLNGVCPKAKKSMDTPMTRERDGAQCTDLDIWMREDLTMETEMTRKQVETLIDISDGQSTTASHAARNQILDYCDSLRKKLAQMKEMLADLQDEDDAFRKEAGHYDTSSSLGIDRPVEILRRVKAELAELEAKLAAMTAERDRLLKIVQEAL